MSDKTRLLEENQDEEQKDQRQKSNSSILFIVIAFILIGTILLLALFYNGGDSIVNEKVVLNPVQNSTSNSKDAQPKQDPNTNKKPMMAKETIKGLYGYGTLSEKYDWFQSESKFKFNLDLIDGHYIDTIGSQIVLKHAEFENQTVLVDLKDVKDKNGKIIEYKDWKFSSDLSKLLLAVNFENGWRHGYFADYYVYDLKSKKLGFLNSSISDKHIPEEKGSGKTSFTLWGPVGNTIAWVRDNDLFVTKNDKEVRITTDGSKNVINGIADWVYEEEVLANQQSTWISADSNSIAFIKYNETLVSDYEIQYFAKYGEDQYPHKIDIKYPKPGTNNPIVDLYISTLIETDGQLNSKTSKVNFENNLKPDDRLITEVKWTDDKNSLLVRIMNRVQDYQELYAVTRDQENNEWTAKVIRKEQTEDNAWIGNLQPIKYVKTKQGAISYLELIEDKKGFYHIAQFNSIYNSVPDKWITSGNWEVVTVNGVDESLQTIYYTSTEMGSMQRHLYSINFDGTRKTLLSTPKVSKLRLSQSEDSIGNNLQAGYYETQFSPGCKYFVIGYLGPDLPWQRLEKIGDG